MTSSTQEVGAEPLKIPMFGARRVAQDMAASNSRLSAEVVQLRELMDQIGAADLLEVRRRTQEESVQFEHARESARAILDNLTQQIAAASEELAALQSQLLDVRHSVDVQEVALYDFEHPAESSAELASHLTLARSHIKQAVRDGWAASATTQFTFNNSSAKGARFVKQMTTMLLAAYNAEAENCIKAVKAGGLSTAQKRLDKAVERVARNGIMIDLCITPEYHRLRLIELELAARHMNVLRQEKELERERRAELREQQKAEQELRRERERLSKERDHYLNALEALQARGDEQGIAELQAKLADVDQAIATVDYREANQRAGYVYVISNEGSFGDHIVKIGMTRRLEPMDRVKELGDASVPFRFDVHALFFADDAVGIEAMLHREFAAQRVNRVNLRREYFYCTPQHVLDKLREKNVNLVEYRTEVDPEEFRLSEAIRGSELGQPRRRATAGAEQGARPL